MPRAGSRLPCSALLAAAALGLHELRHGLAFVAQGSLEGVLATGRAPPPLALP